MSSCFVYILMWSSFTAWSQIANLKTLAVGNNTIFSFVPSFKRKLIFQGIFKKERSLSNDVLIKKNPWFVEFVSSCDINISHGQFQAANMMLLSPELGTGQCSNLPWDGASIFLHTVEAGRLSDFIQWGVSKDDVQHFDPSTSILIPSWSSCYSSFSGI
jgi:hypothetical protein